MNISVYLLPTLIIMGTIGNILTMVVYFRKPMRSFSVGLYLAVYSADNTLILILIYGGSWLAKGTPYREAENLSDLGCRITQYVNRMVMHYGIWLLVVMTLDRYIYVCHPYKANNFCKVFMSKTALILIAIGVTLVSIHSTWTYEFSHGHCFPLLHNIYYVIWNWFSASCLTFLPLLILLILDILLVIGLCTHSHPNREPGTQRISVDLTNTVLGLSLTYLTLAFPATIINVIYYTMPMDRFTDMDFIEELKLATSISNFMNCVNQAFIFFVCVILSSSFRGSLRDIIVRCRQKNEAVSNELTVLTAIKGIPIESSKDTETLV
ncbi:G-protein coupled receptor B0563.6 [Mizuhopecten yessoensis]|uniref:G-protein coupled receptor B0563.6 n=1 Tax=Mizuhopecten yessoensis TaxID=6573 RepID=A0A210QHZ6_MIZYE|nr:G-protein coupled receptor B0563.6 [Mizuhopecten yessoensis]